MKKVLIIAILMCVLCGCHRSVSTVEFEAVEFVEEETVRSVPDVYYCPPGEISQHKNVSWDVGVVSDMSFIMEWIEISIPQEATLSSYFFDGKMLYYSYSFWSYIFDGTGNQGERLLNDDYSTKLMCYNTVEKTTTEIATYPNASDANRIIVSGDYLSFTLWTIREDSAFDYSNKIIYIGENEMKEVELTNTAITEQNYFGIADGMYALTSNNTVRTTINKIAKVDLEKDLAEYIMLKKEYDEVYYSKGYLICKENSSDIYKIDIYDLNGEYIMGFKVTSYVLNVVCNDKLCAWITDDLEGEGDLLYVYSYESDTIHVMDCDLTNSGLECDGDRVYFGGELSSGISCYDSHYNALCKELITGMSYQIDSGEGKGIFGQVTDPLSSTVEIDEEGRIVYSFYRIK